MAEPVLLFLKANGKDIAGDGPRKTPGRDRPPIECITFEHAVNTARETATGAATGRRTYDPIVIRKRIDASSVLLAKAMVNNEVIEGNFLFFRPGGPADGSAQPFYTIEITDGRLAGLRQYVPDTTDAAHAAAPPLEELKLTFHRIKWTWTEGGKSHEDAWVQNG
jgi:type VI secretion system secreted protein Hcp